MEFELHQLLFWLQVHCSKHYATGSFVKTSNTLAAACDAVKPKIIATELAT